MNRAAGGEDITIEVASLRDRVFELETLLARIYRELEPVFDHPEVSFLTIHRIATLARRRSG